MFDFSFAELALIVIVAVVFIGPKELPTVVRAAAKGMRALRSLTKDIRNSFDELARESGLKEASESLDYEMRMIRGDDGKLYESYAPKKKDDSTPPPVGGRLGGGHG